MDYQEQIGNMKARLLKYIEEDKKMPKHLIANLKGLYELRREENKVEIWYPNAPVVAPITIPSNPWYGPDNEPYIPFW